MISENTGRGTDPSVSMNLQKGTNVHVKISTFQMRRDSLLSREWEGVVKAIAYWKPEQVQARGYGVVGQVRSVLIEGSPDTRRSEHCHRCGKLIENKISIYVGYGPICSDYLGIPRQDVLTEDMVDSLRAHIRMNFKREIWCETTFSNISILPPTPHTPESANGHAVSEKIQHTQEPAAPAQEKPATTATECDVRFSIDTERNEIIVDTGYGARARSVVGWRVHRDGEGKEQKTYYKYTATPGTAEKLKDAFEGLKRRGTPEFMKLLAQVQARETAQELKEGDVSNRDIPNLIGHSWAHQIRGYDFIYTVMTGVHKNDNG